jgi:hypothetical protein
MFGIGIIELVLIPAIQFQLVPALQMSANMTLNPSDAAGFAGHVAQTLRFMKMAMYTVLVVLFVYAIISVFKREETEFYQP